MTTFLTGHFFIIIYSEKVSKVSRSRTFQWLIKFKDCLSRLWILSGSVIMAEDIHQFVNERVNWFFSICHNIHDNDIQYRGLFVTFSIYAPQRNLSWVSFMMTVTNNRFMLNLSMLSVAFCLLLCWCHYYKCCGTNYHWQILTLFNQCFKSAVAKKLYIFIIYSNWTNSVIIYLIIAIVSHFHWL